MKKLLFFAVLLVGSLPTMAEDGVTASSAVSKDLKRATVNVDLTNSVAYVAFQMDIVFPTTMDLTAASPVLTSRLVDEDEDVQDFVAAYNMVNDYTLRVVVYNLSNRSISGTSGDRLFSVTLTEQAESAVATEAADWTPTLSNVLFVTAADLEETDLSSTSATDGYLLGDANDDGAVTALDVTATVAIIFNTEDASKYNKIQADANNDGQVTALDVTKIVNMVFDIE